MFKIINGRGTVVCQFCRKVIEDNISIGEYNAEYKGAAICDRCRDKRREKQTKHRKHKEY